MVQTKQNSQVPITSGKFKGLCAITNEHGIITAVATDQRGSLKKALTTTTGSSASAVDLITIKECFVEVFGPYVSALLIDPEFGLSTILRRASHTGVFLAYERTGFNPRLKGRLPELLPEWSVRRLIDCGANGIKILLYYDPDDAPTINKVKHSFIERVGAECRAYDVPFFLEPVSYSDLIGDKNTLAFAEIKPDKVKRSIQEFSKPYYSVDVLKVELPVDVRYVAGLKANASGQYAYNYADAITHLREAATMAQVPFIYLSATATAPVFAETLALIAEAGTPFSGVLYGLDLWYGSVAAYVQGGVVALRDWLQQQAVPTLQAFNQTVAQYATPWWDMHGGQHNLAVIEL